MLDVIPVTGGEWSLAQLPPASLTVSIRMTCSDSSNSGTSYPTCLHFTPSTAFPSCWTKYLCRHQWLSLSHQPRWAPLTPQSPSLVLKLLTQRQQILTSSPKGFSYNSLSVCESWLPASQMPIRSHPDADVQLSPCMNKVFACSNCQTTPLISSVNLTVSPPTTLLSPALQICLSFLFQTSYTASLLLTSEVCKHIPCCSLPFLANLVSPKQKMTNFLFHSLPHQFSHCLSRQFLSTDFILWTYFASYPQHFPKTSCSCLPCYLNGVAYFSAYFPVPPQPSKGFSENIHHLIFKCFLQHLQNIWNFQRKDYQNHLMWQKRSV